MKKFLLSLLMIVICTFLLPGCDTALPDSSESSSVNDTSDLSEHAYRVEILNADNFDIMNELKESYEAGEKVTISEIRGTFYEGIFSWGRRLI